MMIMVEAEEIRCIGAKDEEMEMKMKMENEDRCHEYRSNKSYIRKLEIPHT